MTQLAVGLQEIAPGIIKTQEPMRNHTSLHIGGPADYLVVPQGIDQLKALLHFSRKEFVPLFILGGGTNLLVSDKGIRGIVVKLDEPFKKIEFDGHRVTVGAGLSLPVLAQRAARQGLSGLEFAGGIPGTVGGAVSINAGAYGDCMAIVICSVTVLTWEGEVLEVPAHQLEFSYRCSGLLKKNWIVLESHLELVPGDPIAIRERMEGFLAQRRAKHPTEPSAGSVFKNLPEEPAGRLIEGANCKGLRVGDAQVSNKHANFIVNLGRATFKDYLKVILTVQKRVFEKYGVWLNPEINMVGEES